VVHARDFSSGPLARDDVEHYAEMGYLVIEGLFEDREIRALQDELEALRQGKQPVPDETRIEEPGKDDALRSIFAIHANNPLFARLASDSRLTDIAQFLLDDEVYIHQSRLNYKPGLKGKEFYWHSDFETWHVEDGMPRMRALSMSVALTDNAASNGALMLVPGSHKRYLVCSGETPEDHFQQSLQRQEYGTPDDGLLRTLVDEGGIETIETRPGTVILFDCNTMHGSNSNITPYARSNAFLVYNALRNQVTEPFCEQAPRPEFICSRRGIAPVSAISGNLLDS
jgi:ectoine hydroxylase